MTDMQDTAADLCEPEHFEQFRGEVTRLLEDALLHYTSTGTGPGPEKWRGDSRETVAAQLALTLTAGIAPVLDRHTSRSVLGTLAELQRPRDIYMRPRNGAEERRRFWVPDQAAQARAVEVLRQRADGEHLYAFVPLVQPGKRFGVWAHGQEVVTVRPAMVLGRRSHVLYVDAARYGDALRQALDIARAALNDELGTVACALVALDGSTVVIEAGPGGKFATSEQQEEATA